MKRSLERKIGSFNGRNLAQQELGRLEPVILENSHVTIR
jgi:hypothetical protein